jgi:hypothetical protein
MKAIDRCVEEVIEVEHRSGRLHVSAYRLGDFAVHEIETGDFLRQRFAVTHLPTARCIARGFVTLERAADAMERVGRLRNDWAIITDEELTDELRRAVDETVRPFGGSVGANRDPAPTKNWFNGYRPERLS